MKLCQINKLIVSTFSLCILLYGASCDDRETDEKLYQEGQWEAGHDLAKGEYKIAFAAHQQMPTSYGYTDVLRKKYNIGYSIYGLTKNLSGEEAWVRGYNNVAIEAIQKKWGNHVLTDAIVDGNQ